jgi:hypothetical protein
MSELHRHVSDGVVWSFLHVVIPLPRFDRLLGLVPCLKLVLVPETRY